MRHILINALVIFSLESSAQGSFHERQTNASNLRLNITNVGTFGNAFRGYKDGSNNPSCEYPVGSGIEHLFEGGFWFGALINGNTVAVSTSAYDASTGYSTGRSGFEFTSTNNLPIVERSTISNSPFFSQQAISHQDFFYQITDTNILIPGTNIAIANHQNPMGIKVSAEAYNWNYSFSDFFVIVNFTVENIGQNTLDSAYFALWNNTVVRNVNISPAGSGGSAFYNKGGNGFLDSLLLAYCFDAGGDLGFTESYIGQKFLGAEDKFGFHHPEVRKYFDCHYNPWQFNNTSDPLYFLPSSDQARYIKMTKGLNKEKCWNSNSSENPDCPNKSYSEQINEQGNRSDLVSVGPFRDFQPGEKITVAYAYVIAPKKEDGKQNTDNNFFQQTQLRANAKWAQTAYNGEDKNFNGVLDEGEDVDGDGKITRFILPSPPDLPKFKVITSPNKIDLFWTKNAESSVDPITKEKDFEGYRVYLSKFGFDVTNIPNLADDLMKIAEFDKAGNQLFYETGFDDILLPEPLIFENDTTQYYYHYAINNVLNGWQYAVSITSFDKGNEASNLTSLESSKLSNNKRAFAGKPSNENLQFNKPFVYPNPYYAGASWEGFSNFQEQSRKIYFANLPNNCVIRIFTVSGDFIDEIYHNQEYKGNDIRWFKTFGAENENDNQFSGGEHAWDLLSEYTQIINRGLYMFTVEDLNTGQTAKGNFTIIK